MPTLAPLATHTAASIPPGTTVEQETHRSTPASASRRAASGARQHAQASRAAALPFPALALSLAARVPDALSAVPPQAA
ncbi:hypothetical protein WS70_12250 [Burkholderia mayonis]|uniref:Uncharacterized protein n=1 Tax=Burkholderia mayonis TaxID=1385591 RepID=A0A1B4FFM6_9BURK|nr:hypothetical protein WS70_12250 [Burkholderia mayonis]KVE48727.1 hypothetical protein WS70_21990 [Burkholderia mayonis]